MPISSSAASGLTQSEGYQKNQQSPHTPQQSQYFNLQQNRLGNTTGAPVRTYNPIMPIHPKGCFRCGELGHYANICPTRNMQTSQIQKNNGQRTGHQSSQVHTGNPNYQGNRSQQNYKRGRVNNLTTETTQDTSNVVFDTFDVNS